MLGIVVRQLTMSKERGAWLSTIPATVNGTELSAIEFCDRLHQGYNKNPPDMCSKCDGCGAKFTLAHALGCRKGGLIILRHDEIKDELAELLSQALIPSAVRDEPSIQPGPRVTRGAKTPENQSGSEATSTEKSERRGDLLVRGLWERSKHCVIDVRVSDVNQPSYILKCPKKVLAMAEKEKKKKHLKDCHEQRKDFPPFVVSVDGLLGKDAQMLLKKISAFLAAKWGRPYSQTAAYVNA